MSFLPIQATLNLKLLFLFLGAICILRVNGSWDEEEGLLRLGKGNQREFDYFKLALQWPGTYCRRSRYCCASNACCRGSNSPSVFTIHGLWTEYNDGTWPSCCSGHAFNPKEISTLLEPLEKYWPSLSCGSPRGCHHKKGTFWGHEWEKHGTCASSVVRDEYQFFLTTLNVYFKYNITEVLFGAGYVPSNSKKYPLGGVISAIQNAFHTTPELICSGDALEELRICFYKNFEPRECAHDTSSRGSCPKYISLPVSPWISRYATSALFLHIDDMNYLAFCSVMFHAFCLSFSTAGGYDLLVHCVHHDSYFFLNPSMTTTGAMKFSTFCLINIYLTHIKEWSRTSGSNFMILH